MIQTCVTRAKNLKLTLRANPLDFHPLGMFVLVCLSIFFLRAILQVAEHLKGCLQCLKRQRRSQTHLNMGERDTEEHILIENNMPLVQQQWKKQKHLFVHVI